VTYQGKVWNYLPFPMPPGGKKMGEDNQSVKITLPNVGSGQYGYLPIRDWVQEGTLSNAYFVITTLVDDSPWSEQTYTVAEREFKDGENQGGQITISLRLPDDGFAMILGRTYNEDIIGSGLRYAPT
jgi:hypothetical protein